MKRYSQAVAPTTVSAEYGIRNHGDWRYGDRAKDTWIDNYYDPLHSQFGEYLMGGEREWFVRAETMCRHLMDIDIIHETERYPDRAGGITGYDAPHHDLDTPVRTYCLSAKGYLDYYHLTGDPDALETATGLAQYIIRAHTGLGARSVREQAWPLTTLLAVYRETYDPEVFAAAAKLFDDCLIPLDPRRGSYPEWHATWVYAGTIPWMSGQMMEDFALYWWETHDRRAAAALVGLAESLYCENMGGPEALPIGGPVGTPGSYGPGGTRGPLGVTTYSPNPFQAGWAPGYVFLTNTGWAYAYDLTGRKPLLEAARAGYKVAVDQKQIGLSTYWQAPILLYYLNEFKGK
jgi:hypothetical protein